ncbi:RNA ligase family protein [Halostagnicola sp. A-GB9-2]|uniref:RNA ligase family protein n=1 Tax=Halostagnicola sp. A-GB9-2 TaxID=3048066 RepID=UPI0024C08870|nr:RNA ligase family protein [Halostagnicola sp. A-GB9-2]MDJ1430509.1 RNA ligase family protein [Halostagnicola sp. A-GB9-2]
MKKFPSIPRVANAPDDLLKEGHLWLLEKVDGANFRFQLRQSGLVRFGDRSRVYDDPDEVPVPYRHAVDHVRENIDREALRNAVDDVEDIVFFGEAMHRHAIEYDWGRTPSFLGFDVWSADAGKFYPLDTAERIFDRIGLRPVNVFERERRARDFDPDSYAIPESKWYDGPAEGVIVRDKRGRRAKLLHPAFREVDETVPVDAPVEALAGRYVTERRLEKVAAKLEDRNRPVNFETLYDRVVTDIVREAHKELYHGSAPVDMESFRSEVGALTRRYLEARNDDSWK